MDPFTTLATLGGGVFSAAAAADLGVGSARIQEAVRRGQLVRLTRGWYTTSARMREGDEQRHRLRTHAVTSRFGEGVVATHHSALTVYNLPLLEPDLRVVHVGSRETKKTMRGKGHVMHVLPKQTVVAAATPPPAVSPAFAVVQVGLLKGPRASLVAADQALRRDHPDLLRGPVQFGRCSQDELDQAVAAYRRVPGIAAVANILRFVDPKAESVGESRLRHALHLLRIPIESQFPIEIGDHTYRADFRVKGTRMLIEFDGLVKLDDPLERRRADERERALRRQHWIIVRFTWSEVGKLNLIAKRLAEAAETEGLPWPVAVAA